MRLGVRHKTIGEIYMHVHVCHNESMRTTIEIKPEHRAQIIELAAKRGEKGFSGVIAEALEQFLASQKSRKRAIRDALALKGSMSEAEVAGLLSETRKIRDHWR
jgi:hypothetical protein